ncbi:MAG: capsule assembly Wzi family protein [Steroidobacteraceae bacterium]
MSSKSKMAPVRLFAMTGNKTGTLAVVVGGLLGMSALTPAMARGVSPYLPLNMSPAIEKQIERVLILAGKPATRRPIPAAWVSDALPAACRVDAQLCASVENYLERYKSDYGVPLLTLEGDWNSGSENRALPNEHGRSAETGAQLSTLMFYQPSDHVLLSGGAILNNDSAVPTGSMLSAGFDFAQLDIGFRDHWLSPMSGSSMLIGTEASTMPSVTLSNYRPLTPLGLTYEVFAARMSKQDGITYFGGMTSGNPHLAGMQLGIEPTIGYALTLNRVMQYGGGARGGGGFSAFVDALGTTANLPEVAGQQQEFGNQLASVTSSILFPGKVPFAVNIEYAGEDNAYSGKKRLGDTALTLGLALPHLGSDFDLNYEISEWQNVWYTHHIYPLGLTNDGYVLGHWFGDQRQVGDRVGGRSHVLQAGWQASPQDYWQATYRMLMFTESNGFRTSSVDYQHGHELAVRYSTAWRGHDISAQLTAGQDVLGDKFVRVSSSLGLLSQSNPSSGGYASDDTDGDGETELFVDVGQNVSKAYERISFYYPNAWTPVHKSYHVGVGARRPVSERSDLGFRLELDKVAGRELLSVRALDYRYRLTKHLAASGFIGAGRYDFGAPAFGWYLGAGTQWMNVIPKWDVGFDWRHYDKLTRNRVLSTDYPYDEKSLVRIHFDISGYALYVSRHF